MAEPKKETVRIVLPSSPVIPPRRRPPTITPPSSVAVEQAGQLPAASLHRPPPSPSAAAPLVQPLPKPTAPEPLATEDSVQPGPKKETTRITILPKPAVKMPQTQPVMMRPGDVVQTIPPVVATSNATDPFESIPRWFCWSLLGISALIFFTQIWNYAVS